MSDPLRRRIRATWLAAEHRAVVEMASASGLSRVGSDERDPYAASSRGTGDLLLAAIAGGAATVILGIGGSATTDGGRGLLEGLGATVTGPGPEDRDWRGVGVDLDTLDNRLRSVTLEVACDVDNPLLGPRGGAATYGPQKGALAADIPVLDARNAAWAGALERVSGRHERDTPGAGAAGGVGFALLCLAGRFKGFELRPGVDLVMEATGFDAALREADVVITGEGRVDAQTAFGKTALGVARRAQAASVPCYVVGGTVEAGGAAALAAVGAAAIAANDHPVTLEEARRAGTPPIEAAAEGLASRITREAEPATMPG